ncbi:uncharacterized protein A4U43_C03F17740 [Asparagus officinalis]|uniref:Uncharacterized protein n=1 Tax=Asparagus officinalis TaxID=4686 RepID=A0A5P1FF78_ASPOF|nr:uncharacterized protein A4U43_C03F17740 [Asparagus officinalis]
MTFFDTTDEANRQLMISLKIEMASSSTVESNSCVEVDIRFILKQCECGEIADVKITKSNKNNNRDISGAFRNPLLNQSRQEEDLGSSAIVEHERSSGRRRLGFVGSAAVGVRERMGSARHRRLLGFVGSAAVGVRERMGSARHRRLLVGSAARAREVLQV